MATLGIHVDDFNSAILYKNYAMQELRQQPVYKAPAPAQPSRHTNTNLNFAWNKINQKTTQQTSTCHSIDVALCAIAKNENRYIREWVEYYKELGIAKIFLYDNNDADGERFESVINDYISSGYVQVIDFRGKVVTTSTDKTGNTMQGMAYKDCYDMHYSEYDWICFFDIDEFLELYSGMTLQKFLCSPYWNNFDGIHVSWMMYGDNGQLYYQTLPVRKRFYNKNIAKCCNLAKTILKGKAHYKKGLIFCAHGPMYISGSQKQASICNLDGSASINPYRGSMPNTRNPFGHLCHFYSKSTEEFIERKWKKTSAVTGVNKLRNFDINFLKKQYFEFNSVTVEKAQMFDALVRNNSVEKIDKNDTIIVNFTTWKKRDHCVIELLKYFSLQTLKADKIICWLSQDEYDGKIPGSIQYCLNHNLLTDVKFVPGNIYGHKRYETFKYNINAYNIFIDDDIYYPTTYVEELYKACKENPHNATCYYTRCDIYGDNGVRTVKKMTDVPSFTNRYFSGLAAFPPNLFPTESFNYASYRDKYCQKCDDSWVNAWLIRYEIKINGLHDWGQRTPLHVINDTQKDGIFETHNGKKINGIMQISINIANCIMLVNRQNVACQMWP